MDTVSTLSKFETRREAARRPRRKDVLLLPLPYRSVAAGPCLRSGSLRAGFALPHLSPFEPSAPRNSAYPYDFFNRKIHLLEAYPTHCKQTSRVRPNRQLFGYPGFFAIRVEFQKAEILLSSLRAKIDLQFKFTDGERTPA